MSFCVALRSDHRTRGQPCGLYVTGETWLPLCPIHHRKLQNHFRPTPSLLAHLDRILERRRLAVAS